MPRPVNQIRLRWIWLTIIMGLEIDEVSLLLQISKRTISRYVQKFNAVGKVNTAVIGRPYSDAPSRGTGYN